MCSEIQGHVPWNLSHEVDRSWGYLHLSLLDAFSSTV